MFSTVTVLKGRQAATAAATVLIRHTLLNTNRLCSSHTAAAVPTAALEQARLRRNQRA
jgi:hypothetical protein